VGVGDWDNSGPIGGPVDDAAGVLKTIDINIVGTLDTTVSPPEIDVTSGGLGLISFSGDVININSADDPPFDIEVPETGSVDLSGQSITLSVNPVVPGIITGGTVTTNSLTFTAAGVEQVLSSGTLTITANTQAGSEPVSDSTITVTFQAIGSISHGDSYEATGIAEVVGTSVSLPGGADAITALGTIELYCIPVGELFITCSATINFDGVSESGLPVDGTLVINDFTSTRTASFTAFFDFTEYEDLTAFPLFLEGGVSSTGPIAKAKLQSANFAFSSHLYRITTMNPMTLTSEGMGIRSYSPGSSFAALDIDTGEMVRFLTSATIDIPALESLTLIDPVTLTPTTYTGPTTVTIPCWYH
jgi:hypothetical protein